MGTIAQKLTYLEDTKTAIGNAIAAKGGSVTGKTFRQYATEISNLPSGGGGVYEEVDVMPTSFEPKTTIKSVDIPEGVTTIPGSAFQGYTALEKVTFPSTLTSIGNQSFYGSGLKSVTYPYLTSAGTNIFDGCHSLESITIDDNVTGIRNYTFSDCENIKTLYVGKKCRSIPVSGYSAFTYGIKNTITVHPENTYYYVQTGCLMQTSNKHLILGTTTGVIPNDTTYIERSAFRGLTGLTSVTIPDSVTGMETYVFQDSGLTSLNTGDGLTTIPSDTYSGCPLVSLHIGKSITSINCNTPSTVTQITVDAENATFDSRNNCNAIINSSTNRLEFGCSTTVIPSTVTALGDTAFLGMGDSSTTLMIPDSVTSLSTSTGYSGRTFWNSHFREVAFGSGSALTGIIAQNVFGNSDITTITLPDGVTVIQGSDSSWSSSGGAFRNCKSLTTVTIGTGLTNIGYNAFNGCTSLQSVTIKATTPPTLSNSNAFSNTNNCPIYVPAASVDAYKAATNWISLASRIQAIPEE